MTNSSTHVDLLVVLHPHQDVATKLLEVLQKLQKATLNEPGCIHYRIGHTDSATPVYFLQERWRDTQAFHDHELTAHFLEGVEKIQSLCSHVDLHHVLWVGTDFSN